MIKKILFLFYIFFHFSFTHAEIIILDKKNIDKEIFIPKDETIKSLIKKNETFWYGAYIDDKKVGWFKISFGNKKHLNIPVYEIEEEMFYKLSLPGNDGNQMLSENFIKSTYTFETKDKFNLIKFDEIYQDNENNISIKKGIKKKDEFHLLIENNQVTKDYIIKNLSETLKDRLALEAWFLENKVKKDDQFYSTFFDFEQLFYLNFKYLVDDVNFTKVNGIDYNYYKVKLDEIREDANTDLVVNIEYIIDNQGKYLNFSLIDLFEFRLENEKTAKDLSKEEIFFLDTGISIEPNLPDKIFSKELDSVIFEFSGDAEAIYDGGIQKLIKLDNGNYEISIGLPLIFEQVDGNEHKENLKETINYPINSEKIKNLAREIIGDEVSKEIIIDKLLNFVSEYIEDDYENNTTSVFDIIKNKKGDCTEHALLFTTLARSLGIPTKEITGWAYDFNGNYVLHAWNEVAFDFEGDTFWIPVDPTWNEVIPRYHIKSSGKNVFSKDYKIFFKEAKFADGEIIQN